MDNSNNIFLLLFSITMEINIFIIIYYNKYRIYANIYKYTFYHDREYINNTINYKNYYYKL